MPKIIAHLLTGAAVTVAVHPTAGIRNWTPLFLGALLGISADFDFGPEWAFDLSGIHRGFTHSLIFSIFVGLIIYFWIGNEQLRITLAFSSSYFSHILLDFLTSTEGGIKLLYPFSNNYYNFGLTNVFERPLGSNLMEVLTWCLIETLIFLPVFLFILLIKERVSD